MNIDSFMVAVLTMKLWFCWWAFFHQRSFVAAIEWVDFNFKVLSGLICYLCFAQKSTVTLTKPDGEIIKEVHIG